MMGLATPPLSSSSSSSSSATVAVEKATSDLLIGPDWTMNIDICDSLNSHHWQAKDVVKAVKKRLQHKNPRVQLLALTLLETMVKNCGDYVHFQIAEKNILGEMVKIVKKKTDMHVRDKILVLLDSWQEAFGGPGGKYPQYYWAYEDLRRSGVEFPQRTLDAAPIFTPPVTHPTLRHAQAGYGMPNNSSRRLDETMATDVEGLSLSSLESMQNVMELLNDMLQAVDPRKREAVKDEVIVDLVDQCRSNQKKLMQMLTSTGDEELLGRGLELNDSLQILLAKHDAIASGSPLPTQITSLNHKPSEESSSNIKLTEVRDASPKPASNPVAPDPPIANFNRGQIDDEEEEEDDFAQLARRHSKTQSSSSQSSSGSGVVLVSADTRSTSTPANTCNALALPDPPAPVRTTKEQDMIDFLSITLSTTSTSPHPQTPHTPPASNHSMPHTPPASNHSMPQIPVSSGTQGQGYPYGSQTFQGNQGQVSYNSYVVPWAQPQPQNHLQPPSHSPLQSRPLPQQQPQHHLRPPSHSPLQPRPQHEVEPVSQPQQQFQPQPQPEFKSQFQPQLQPQYPQYSSGYYPPPPWAATPGYANGQSHISASSNNNTFSTPQANSTISYSPMQTARPLQHYNSFPSRGSDGSTMNGDPNASPGPKNPTASGQKPFIPSYRLFEDLNVLGGADGRLKMTSSTSSSLSGTPGPSMVGGRK